MSTLRYHDAGIRALTDLERLLAGREHPVLLLEGTRALPEADRPLLVSLGRLLAERLPRVRFRSGNAEGTDTAFAEGVVAVDAGRMEYVITHAGMGRRRLHPGGQAFALQGISQAAEHDVASYTVAASPHNHALVTSYCAGGRRTALGAKGAYLLRDTAKVVGVPALGLAPATAALFYANVEEPLSGGTGHTLRVCLQRGVPAVLQGVWRHWT